MGLEIGDSLLEEDRIDTARQLLTRVEKGGLDLQLPVDCVVADRFAADAQVQVVACDAIPRGWQGMDIGPQTRQRYADQIARGGTIVWNGPLGVCEMVPFAQGTQQVAQALAAATREGAVSLIGGGDTAAAVAQAGLAQADDSHLHWGRSFARVHEWASLARGGGLRRRGKLKCADPL